MATALVGAVTLAARRRVSTLAAAALAAGAALLAPVGGAGAQQPTQPARPDTARAPRPTPTTPPRDVTPSIPARPDSLARVDSAARRDTARAAGPRPRSSIAAPTGAPQPPISPKRAFVYSLLVPGLGQSKLERQTVGAIFVAVEAGILTMARKSYADLKTAKRLQADTVVLSYPLDPTTGEPTTPPERGPGYFTQDLVSARRLHYEDWIALLLFNHVLAGAEAFVAANLWDLPTQVSAGPGPGGRGTTLAVRVAW